MNTGRRSVLLAGVGLLIAGCEKTTSVTSRPRPSWPTVPSSISPTAQPDRAVVAPAPQPIAAPVSSASPTIGRLRVIPRSKWTQTGPTTSKVVPMRGINRITVHHEGWRPVLFSDSSNTGERIEMIRASHTGQRGWGDIGYHFIVDRAGRVWEGRPLPYQGAHVKHRNEHNIGILVLGNFDRQMPTQAQLNGLQAALAALSATHRIPTDRIYTHRELNPTACPGRYLQPRMASIRQSLV